MAKKELTKKLASDYGRATKLQKGRILNSLCLTTDWSRSHARRQLKRAIQRPRSASPPDPPKTRPRKYSTLAQQVLTNLWAISGQCCGQYLFWQIKEGLLERLLGAQELHLGPQNKGTALTADHPVLVEIRAMSSATIDRYLASAKRAMHPLSPSTTKPASYLLRREIPFGKSYAEHLEPGWLSTDTVAHCGDSLKGDYLWTLNSTDTLTGWTETLSIKGRASTYVRAGHEELLPRFPFPILGINYDGGSEFINRELIDYAQLQHYHMTRSRPYTSNDNAHVEQKNADIVRRYAFRYRYNGNEAMDMLNTLWRWVNLRKNYLVPTRKCIGHTKTKSGRTRGIYDRPKAPVQRLLEHASISSKSKRSLRKVLATLNDAKITRCIVSLQEKLMTLALDAHLLEYMNQEIRQVISA